MNLQNLIFGLEHDESLTCATFIKSLVNLLSRLLWLPVRFQWVNNSKQPIYQSGQDHESCKNANIYELRKPSRFSKIVRIVGHVGAVIAILYGFYENVIYNHTGKAAYIFTVVADVCQIVILFLTWKWFWLRPEVFSTLLNELGRYEIEEKPHWKLKVCASSTFLVFLILFMGFASPHQRAAVAGLTSVFTNVTATTFKHLDFTDSCICDNTDSESILYKVLYPLAYWFQRSSTVAEFFIIAVAYTVYRVGKAFTIKIRTTSSIDELTVQLWNLKRLNEQINSAVGPIYLINFISNLTYYACMPAYLSNLSITVLYQYWYKLVYFSIHSITWICTSEYHRLVLISLRRWISDKTLSQDLNALEVGKLNILAQQIEHDPVGISCRYFTVNYQLLSSLAGLLITYSIIAVQVQEN